MKENEVTLQLLNGIMDESMNPIACVKIVIEEGEEAILFIYMNKAFEALFGDNAQTMLENSFKISEIEEYNANDGMFMSIIEAYRTGKEVYKTIEIPYLAKHFNLKAYSPMEGHICLTFADITELEMAKKDAQQKYDAATSSKEQLKYQVDFLSATKKQVEMSTKIHQLVAQASSDGFYYRNYRDNFFYASESWYSLFTYEGIRPNDSKNILNAIYEKDVFAFSRWLEQAISEKKEHFICEFRLLDGKTWIEANFRFEYDEQGKLIEEIAFFKNITVLKKQKEELAYQAYFDSATGLMNRTYLNKLLDEDIERAKKEDVEIDILYIDIDDFKNINDCIGYKMADEFLLKFSMMLKDYENATTKISRFDSDEFVIVIYDGNRHEAQRIAMDIRKRLNNPIMLSNGLTQRLSVSIGINQYPEGGRKAVDLIGNADIALHRVKESGKNAIRFFEPKMLEEFLVKIEMENTIKQALDDDKFLLYYQPQYYTSTKKLRGVEALIRLKDEVLGFVPPAEFIPLSERNGTIVDIGEWVLRKAFEDYSSWCEAYDFEGILSINISPVQFRQITFESTLYYLVHEYHIPPQRVELEITETVFAENPKQLIEMIKRIRNNGIKVSLDDFGTGYSSLAYLKDIPIDTLKIDKTFIDSLGEIQTSDIITSSLIEMVQKLGVEIIAEGVETQAQFEFLKRMNCDNIQGYYLARPMSEDSIRAVIREEKC